MNVSFDDIRGEVLPGGHLVARVPGIVVVIRRDEGAGQASSADLLALIRQAAQDGSPAPGRDLARLLTEWVVTTSAVPGFGTIAATEEGIAVFLHGDVSVSELPVPQVVAGAAAASDLLHLSGRTAAFTVDHLLPWPAGPLVLAAGATPDPEGGSTAIGVLGWSGLVEGLVPGDGIVLGARSTVRGTHGGGRHHSPMPPAPVQHPQVHDTPVPEPALEATQEHPAARPDRQPNLPPVPVAPPTPVAPPPTPVAPPPTPVAPPPAPAAPPPSAPIAPPLTPAAPPPTPAAPPPIPDPSPRGAGQPPVSAAPPPPPPGAAPPKLRPPRVSEQIHGSHVHEARRPPLPIAGVKPPAPRPGAKDQPAHVVVKGFRCSRNHHNDPRVSFCSVCGIRMDQRTGVLIDGRRPPLGLLVLDIGSTFVLDDNYLLGRNPEVDEAVIRSRLRPIRLDDDSGTLSRVHAEIRLEGWDVLLIDRGSANGTYIAAGGQAGWNRLAPNTPVVLSPGTHVRTGRRMFTFESAHARL